ncbi:MAG: hypothetical protein ACR2MG_07305 [Pyrinomonadaceae bacterium]
MVYISEAETRASASVQRVHGTAPLLTGAGFRLIYHPLIPNLL